MLPSDNSAQENCYYVYESHKVVSNQCLWCLFNLIVILWERLLNSLSPPGFYMWYLSNDMISQNIKMLCTDSKISILQFTTYCLAVELFIQNTISGNQEFRYLNVTEIEKLSRIIANSFENSLSCGWYCFRPHILHYLFK